MSTPYRAADGENINEYMDGIRQWSCSPADDGAIQDPAGTQNYCGIQLLNDTRTAAGFDAAVQGLQTGFVRVNSTTVNFASLAFTGLANGTYSVSYSVALKMEPGFEASTDANYHVGLIADGATALATETQTNIGSFDWVRKISAPFEIIDTQQLNVVFGGEPTASGSKYKVFVDAIQFDSPPLTPTIASSSSSSSTGASGSGSSTGSSSSTAPGTSTGSSSSSSSSSSTGCGATCAGVHAAIPSFFVVLGAILLAAVRDL
jgi:hypothetical protein